MLHARFSIRAIARELALSPSTVSREILGTYMGLPVNTAQRTASRRRCSQRVGKIVGNSSLQGLVRDHLNQRRSSRQISKRLHAE
ncbi:helix-turn-helix domain-containing protein [Arthrobacter alpinus]|uniref:helix-turn-helix domain-containing protein n=1 Tax=Arthrobacter alpinus TaxID=656366 RepID=UPI0012FEE690